MFSMSVHIGISVLSRPFLMLGLGPGLVVLAVFGATEEKI